MKLMPEQQHNTNWFPTDISKLIFSQLSLKKCCVCLSVHPVI